MNPFAYMGRWCVARQMAAVRRRGGWFHCWNDEPRGSSTEELNEAFRAADMALVGLIRERDARDPAIVGDPPWPLEPFSGVQWRRISDPHGKGRPFVEVAWHDHRDRLRIAQVMIDEDRRPAFLFMSGDDPGDQRREVTGQLSLAYALAEQEGR